MQGGAARAAGELPVRPPEVASVDDPPETPEVIASAELREPVEQTFVQLLDRLDHLVAEAQLAGELPGRLDPSSVAAAIVAVVQ